MAPMKKLTKKEIGLQQRSWITPDIMAAINERNKLYKEFLKKLINTADAEGTFPDLLKLFRLRR